MVSIKRSVEMHDRLEFIYLSDHGKITKRRVKVYANKGDYFLAYCYLRKSVRTFKYNNVLASHPLH